MKHKAVTAIGLDIGSYSIKCVELSRTKDAIELHRVTILPVSDSSDSSYLKVLRLMFSQQTPSLPKHLRISVKGSSLLMRRLQLPLMTPGELKSAIRFEAEGQIPFSVDDCILDFQILNEIPEENKMNVLLVAAKKDFIQKRIDLLLGLGIKPEVIDLDIFCLVNAFEVLSGHEEDKTYGLLNIGHQVSSFAIIHEGLPFFVREILVGGFHVTKTLAELKGISETEADQMKMARPGEDAAVIETATEKGFESLAEELRHSIDFFENDVDAELKFIWASGGGALAAGAMDFLSKSLEKKVLLWDNTKKMSVFGNIDMPFLREHSHQLNVALGMVLR